MRARKLPVILALILCEVGLGQAQTIDEVYKRALTEGGTLNFYGTLAQINAETILPAFEKRFPGIKVNHVDATADQLAARVIAESRGGKVIADIFQTLLDGLVHVKDQGLFLEKLYPEEYARWETDPFSFAPQGGESGLSVTARALPALLEIISAHPAEHVAIASHKATIRLLICSILGFDARTYRDRLDQTPASLNILDFKDPTRGRLTLYNDTSHYAASDSAVPSEPQARLSKWWDRKP